MRSLGVLVVLAVTLLPCSAYAQTGGIAGVVTDATTGVGIQSEVKFFDSSGTERSLAIAQAVTGVYSVTNLPPGTYFARARAAASLGQNPNYVREAYNNIPCLRAM